MCRQGLRMGWMMTPPTPQDTGWTWRQGNHTLTVPETTAIEFNVDGLPPVAREEVEAACAEVAGLITRFCGGTTRVDYLTAETPRISLAP